MTKPDKIDPVESEAPINSAGMQDFLGLKIAPLWDYFRAEKLPFWAICGYLFFEYFRPQSILPALNIVPWTQLFLMLAAIGWLTTSKKDPRVSNSIGFWLIVYFAIVLISCQFATFPKTAYNRLDFIYTWIVIYFLIQLVVTTEKRFFFFLLIFLAASFKLSLFGAQTWALRGFAFTSWGIRGPPGFFTNSGELAVQMAVFFGLSYYFFLAVRKYISGWRYWLVLSFPITAAMTVLGASSRGSQVALVVQAYFMFLHGKVRIRSLLAIAVVIGAGYFLLPEEQMARFQEAGTDKTSQQRLLYWQHGWEMMKEHPFIGVGYYNFPQYYARHYSYDMLYDEPELAHNIFIQVGADLGFTGLAVYLILVWLGFSIPAKVRKRLKQQGVTQDWRIDISKGLGVGFLGFLIGGQFVSIVYYPYMWIHLALSAALLNTTYKAADSREAVK